MPRTLIREPSVDQADAPPARFVCELSDVHGVASIHVAGKLSGATAPQLGRVLREAELRVRLVVLDLRHLQSVDFEGVRLIGYATIHARLTGRRVIAVRGPTQVDRVFAQTGASHVVEIVDLEPSEPPVQALLRLARAEAARGGVAS